MDYRREGGIKGGPLQTLSRKLINIENLGKYLTTFIFSTFTFSINDMTLHITQARNNLDNPKFLVTKPPY